VDKNQHRKSTTFKTEAKAANDLPAPAHLTEKKYFGRVICVNKLSLKDKYTEKL
jgi:hypothetical protein